MAIALEKIIAALEAVASTESAEEWDNVGLLLGDYARPVDCVLTALDVTDDVVTEAIEKKAQLIVSHHPVIFKGVKKIHTEDAIGRRIMKLIESGIAVYAAHTNFDMAQGGTNDSVFEILGLREQNVLWIDGCPLGRTGFLASEMALADLAREAKMTLRAEGLKFVGPPWAKVKKIGLCTGAASGAKYFSAARGAGCDAYITGDVSYHDGQAAMDMGLCVIDATHYATEIIVAKSLQKILQQSAAANSWSLTCHASEQQKNIFHFI